MFIKDIIKSIASSIGRRNPELIVRIRYRMRFHKRIDLDNPKTLNEKIQYLSLRTDTTEWSRLADKYAVREYVKDCGLADTLTAAGHDGMTPFQGKQFIHNDSSVSFDFATII